MAVYSLFITISNTYKKVTCCLLIIACYAKQYQWFTHTVKIYHQKSVCKSRATISQHDIIHHK